jgi:hypothetical protein
MMRVCETFVRAKKQKFRRGVQQYPRSYKLHTGLLVFDDGCDILMLGKVAAQKGTQQAGRLGSHTVRPPA